MENLIIGAVLVVIIAVAVCYIYRAKKSGKKCIGCPESGSTSCSCGCSHCGAEDTYR